MPKYSERFLRLRLSDKSLLDFYREDGDVRICHEERCSLMPGATAQQTFDIIELIKSLAPVEEVQEEPAE